MPSTLSDFRSNTRKLRTTLQVNLGAGLVEQKSNLDNFSILSTLNGSLTGTIDKILDAKLQYSEPDETWAKPGLNVTAGLTITSDDFTTTYTENLFKGYTIRQNTISQDEVQIRANSKNAIYLDRIIPIKKLYQNEDVADIVSDILDLVGVDPGDITLSATGTIVSVYTISNHLTARYYIDDLCKLTLQVMGFNRDGIFTAATVLPVSPSLGSTTPEESFDLSNIKNFKNREILAKNYANRIVIKGEKRRAVTDSTLYFNTQIQHMSVAPGETLFYTNDLNGIDPISINQLDPWTIMYSPTGLYTYKPLTNSRYTFATADDGTGIKNNSDITVLSESIAWDEGKNKDVFFAKFKNNSATTTYYLKYIELIGTGAVTDSSIYTEYDNTDAFESDGGVIEYVLESRAIQSAAIAENIQTLLVLNLNLYSNVYTIEAQGMPNLEVGSYVQLTDRAGGIHNLVIQEIDLEVPANGAVMATYTAKKIPEELPWVALDTIDRGADQTGIILF